jgi:hypothetical protein
MVDNEFALIGLLLNEWLNSKRLYVALNLLPELLVSENVDRWKFKRVVNFIFVI